VVAIFRCKFISEKILNNILERCWRPLPVRAVLIQAARPFSFVVSLCCKHSLMKKYITRNSLTTMIFFLLFTSASMAQNIRGFYVNSFNTILGNSVAETTLLNYTQANGYNYLCLYSLASLDLTNATVKSKLASFISRAKTQYGVIQVGAAGEIYSFFSSYIIPYNIGRPASEKIDVLNFEFEFWIASSVADQYCSQYLIPNHLTCDSAGAFAFAKSQFTQIDQAAAANGLKSEVYFGWPNKGQMQWYAQRADRILLHAYRTSDSDIYSYTKNRLIDIASVNTPVEVMIIFSSETEFMGPWLASNAITKPFETFSNAFTAETGTWKNYIKLQGYQWFKYSTMPPTTVSATAAIAPNGSLTFCSGGSVMLSVTSGPADTYQWTKNASNIAGATRTTYTATATGDYAVKITKSGSSATSSSLHVDGSLTMPQPVVTASGPTTFCPGGSVVLTSSSSSGNHWSTNETTQSIVVSTAGTYSVNVISGSCEETSGETVVSTTGGLTSPVISSTSSKICPGSGIVLTSSVAASGGYVWSTGETTRSIFATSAGTYWVRTGVAECFATSANKVITMKTAPATPLVTVTGSTNLGTGGTVKLTSTNAFAYSWNSGSTRKYINVTTAGTYNVTVTGSNGCKATSAAVVVTSANCTPPAMPVITSNSSNNIITDGKTITLKSSPAGGYLWSNGKTTQTITVTAAGTFTVRAYNAGECYTTSMPITVYTESALGRDQFAATSEEGKISLMSYPNPAHGEFTISFNTEKDETCMINVYDLSGRILTTQEIHAEEGNNMVQMNASTLAPGIYVAHLNGASLQGQVRFMVQ
jgi:hypothetical protein